MRAFPLLAFLSLTLSCTESARSPHEPDLPDLPDASGPLLSGLIASDAILLSNAANTGPGGFSYVSLPPGTLPQGVSVQIRNVTTSTPPSPAIGIIAGGFDPVAVAASAGDVLELAVTDSSGGLSAFKTTVPARRAPHVVRTNPPRGRTDVALRLVASVVFSEPIDAQSIAGAVWLRSTGGAVRAQVAISAGAPWEVELTPDDALQPLTTYELVVTHDVRDLNGDAFVGTEFIAFTTAAAPPPGPVPPDSAPPSTPPDTTPSAPPTGTDSFIPVDDMIVPRFGHTATLLVDGRVLITGGDGNARRSEIYDPATRTFTLSGRPIEARVSHTATLLRNGQVLIVGGGNTSAGAELYDPASGTFIATGHPLIQQYISSATLLPSGNVLVAGVKGAELFDPSTGTFRPAGSYANIGAFADEYYYAATALADDKVLLVGMPDCAQIYDPARDTFSATGCLRIDGLELHTSILLADGKVLVAGGGNDEFGGRSTLAFLYDPARGDFRPTGRMSDGRSAHAAVRLSNGEVLILGGDTMSADNFFAGSLASAELYDPATGVFRRAGSMIERRTGPRATLLRNGDVLITGGWSYCGIGCLLGPLSSAEIYHPGGMQE